MSRAKHVRKCLSVEQGGRCFYCRCHLLPPGVDDDRAETFEHLALKSQGGKVNSANGVAACRRCNTERGDMPLAEFLALKRPGRPKKKRTGPRPDAKIASERAARKARERRAIGNRPPA